jgi:hypothetical protein
MTLSVTGNAISGRVVSAIDEAQLCDGVSIAVDRKTIGDTVAEQ